jgi:hypothetical protein
MKKYIAIVIAFALLVPLVSSTAIAQDTPLSQILWVENSKVIPAKAQEYEAALKDWWGLFKKHKFSAPISVSMGADATYNLLIPMPNYATLDKLFAEYQGMLQKESTKAQNVLKRLGDAGNGADYWIAVSRPDLSYIPENPRLKPEEALFVRVNFFYIEPGTEAKMDAVIKKFVSSFKKHKISSGFNYAVAVTGTDLPFYVINSSGKSAADLWTESDKNINALGDEWVTLLGEFNSLLRSSEIYEYTLRPDLAYTP